MKTIISTIGLSLFFAIMTFGQVEPRLHQSIFSLDYEGQGNFSDYSITNYNYLPSGALESEITDAYNNDGSFFGTSGLFYTYDENEELLLQTTTRRYNSTVKIWITEYWWNYTYDDHGCEASIEFIANVGGPIYKVEYERNADCQSIKEVLFWNQLMGSTDSLSKWKEYEYTYMQDGISYERKEYDFLTGEKLLTKEENYIYDSDGLLEEYNVKRNLEFGNNWQGTKYTYAYDQQGNLILRQLYQNSFAEPDWSLTREYKYLNEYDEQNRLINLTKEKYFMDLGTLVLDEVETTSEATDFACGDLVERTTLTHADVDNVDVRNEYFYEGKNECFEIEKVMLEMSIFPNPSLGEITVESPVLESGNTQIMVVDMNGNLLLEKNEFHREESTTINLSHLPNGMYIVQLMNQEHFVQNKVMIIN